MVGVIVGRSADWSATTMRALTKPTVGAQIKRETSRAVERFPSFFKLHTSDVIASLRARFLGKTESV